ncbi:MAG TPA: GMC family oxidoreductase [Dehalococcoidia bacterium]|jgi:choline dehydrogenase-like flavoprotein
MLIDANSLPEAAVIRADACIIGAGPAGLTLARALEREGVRVCLLESGGLGAERSAQSLSGGTVRGDWVEPLHETRVRRIGGTAHIWQVRAGFRRPGVHYVPLSPVDLERRAWSPHSGWPFGYEELLPYYRRAQRVCGLGPFAYDAAAWNSPATPPLPLCGSMLRSVVVQHGERSVFTRRLPRALIGSRNAALYMHATALSLHANEACTALSELCAVSGYGWHFSVRARTYVLAMGGVENARLLLLSNDRQATGLGNEHDLVGRYLMDHPHLPVGVLLPFDPAIFRRAGLYDARTVRGVLIKGHLTPTETAIRQEKIPNVGIYLYPRPQPNDIAAATAAWSLACRPGLLFRGEGLRLLRHAARGRAYLAPALLRACTRPQPFLSDHSWGGWSTGLAAARGFVGFEVAGSVEQVPDPANRVTLESNVDHLGQRRARVEWQWSEGDATSLRRALDLAAQELARSGVGYFRPALADEPPSLSHHHMGTTRMHGDPRHGVVDEHCRVHGLANLFVAGSSVFPTGGYANPTLTIVALALRLAARITTVLRSEVAPVVVPQSDGRGQRAAEHVPA